jgi:hypothetical protein
MADFLKLQPCYCNFWKGQVLVHARGREMLDFDLLFLFLVRFLWYPRNVKI